MTDTCTWKISSPLAQTKAIKNGHVQESSAPLLESTERPQTEVNPPTRRASSCPRNNRERFGRNPPGRYPSTREVPNTDIKLKEQNEYQQGTQLLKTYYPCWCSSLKPWLRSLVCSCCVFIELFGENTLRHQTSKTWHVWNKSFIYLDLGHICPHNLFCKRCFFCSCFIRYPQFDRNYIFFAMIHCDCEELKQQRKGVGHQASDVAATAIHKT